ESGLLSIPVRTARDAPAGEPGQCRDSEAWQGPVSRRIRSRSAGGGTLRGSLHAPLQSVASLTAEEVQNQGVLVALPSTQLACIEIPSGSHRVRPGCGNWLTKAAKSRLHSVSLEARAPGP